MQDKDSPPDLESLIRQAQNGCPAAKGLLIERYYPWILSVVRMQAGARFRRKESCADMAQVICMQVLEHLGDFEYRGEESFRSWLYAWIQNLVRNRRRYYSAGKRDHRREDGIIELDRVADRDRQACSSTFLAPSQMAILHEETDRIREAMDRLPDLYRDVITQARLLGIPHAEIARRLDRSPEAIRVLLHRAMNRLTSMLQRSDASSA